MLEDMNMRRFVPDTQREYMSPDHDPPHFAIDQKGSISVDRLAETYEDAFVMGEIVRVPRISFISQICRRDTHHTPVVS